MPRKASFNMQLADRELLFCIPIPVLVNQYPKKNHTSSKSLDGEDADPYWVQAVWESKMKTKTGTLAQAQASMSMLPSRLGQKLITCTATSPRSFQTLS